MAYFKRSAWTSAGKGGRVLAGSGRIMRHIYIHYPGQSADIGRATRDATKRRLEGYRRMHRYSRGWADIAYNLAVDQDGNVWELRGIDRQPGANGGTRSNRHGQAILVLVGSDERPTEDCLRGIREAVAMIRREHSQAQSIRGHQESPDASTACPGKHLMAHVRSGALEPGAKVPAGPGGGASVPAPKPKPKAGKAPAFPLPRDSRGMFYYGDPDGPITSVSGRGPNSRVPGDVVKRGGRWKSLGLETFQARMRERGYSITVDGRYGPETERLVRYFQRLVGLKVDGKIGPATWRALWEEPIR